MKKLPLLAIRNSIEALKSDESPLNILKVQIDPSSMSTNFRSTML